MEKCIYDQWFDGELVNTNNFTAALIDAFVKADGDNRQRLITAFPEYFKGSINI